MNLTLLHNRSAGWCMRLSILPVFLALLSHHLYAQPFTFGSSGLNGEGLNNPTSMDFDPDDRLYVSQQNGTIHAYTIERDNAAPGSGAYTVTDTEVINLVKNNTLNHNDDGTLITTQ